MFKRNNRLLIVFPLALMAIDVSHSSASGQAVPKSASKAGNVVPGHSQSSVVKPTTISNDTFTNSAATGLWSTSGNWSSGIPTSSSNVFITGSGSAASITEDVTGNINNMTLNGSNTWTLSNNQALNVFGTAISNAGKMIMNSTANATELIINSPLLTLSGSGTFTMSNNANNYIFAAASGDKLVNQQTIQGAGDIGDGRMTLVNSGVIDSNQSAGMTINPNDANPTTPGLTNTGTIEATSGSTLTLSGTTVDNVGGTISSNGSTLKVSGSTIDGGAVTLTGTSNLQLSNSTIHNGSTLANSSTGTIEAVGFTTNTLGGSIINPSGGVLKIDNGAVLNLENGSYPNLGTVNINSTGNATELIVNGGVTLSGGSVTMSNNAANYIYGAATGDTLTNQETIQGAGHIGDGQMTLVNLGTINANQSAGMTISPNGGLTNLGTIEAAPGTTLALSGTTVANNAGTISANGAVLQVTNSTVNGGTVTLTGASNLQLSSGTIHGGSTLNNSSTGTIEALGFTNNTLGGTISNPAGGLLKLDNGAVLNLENGAYPKLGAVTLNSTGNATELVVDGGVTLSGGTVTLSNNPANYIFGQATGDTLTNQETIQGAGHIGDGQMTLVNSGTIDANQSGGLTIGANGGTTNTGTIEAGSGATLAFSGTTVANAGGKISASGSTLQITNSVINGGSITLTGTSNLQLSAGTIHGGSTLSNSSTGTIEALGFTNNTLGGTITNPAGGLLKIDNGAILNLESGSYPTLGTVNLTSTGNSTELVLGGNVTLSGGTLTLSNNAANYLFGASAGDVLTNQETIQGAGHIGNGSMTLVNSGTIDANQSAGLTIAPNGGTTNTGTMEATSGATLVLSGTTIANAGGKLSAATGTLQVSNSTINGGTVTLTGASNLQLSNGTIHGGSTVTGSSTATIEALGYTNNTLGGTINNPAGGVVKLDNAAVLNLENGSYPTLGTVNLNSTGNNTELVVNGGVTLSGGSVTMSNNAQNYVFGAAAGDTLTNQETIQGAGHIGNGNMTLVNSGTINANQSAGMTIATNGGTTNTGTIEAVSGASLAFSGTTVANRGGTISANGSVLQLTNSVVNGGTVTLTGASDLQLSTGTIHGGSTLNNSPTGTIEALGYTTSTLGGTINNPAGGLVKLDNAAVLNIENGTYPSLGTVNLNSTGNYTELLINGGVTLSGGTVTLSNNPNNYIFGGAAGDTLTNLETIQGAGNIGNNGRLALVNSGLINANQSNPLLIQASSLTNNGTLQVGSGDVLHVEGGTFNNFSTSTLTGGTYNTSGTLEIDNLGSSGGEIVTNAANIVLNGASASFVDAGGKSAIANLAINAPGSGFSLTGGSNFTTVSNFTNNGTLTVGGGSKFSVNGALTNFSGTTLAGGAYNVTGTLQFNAANIVTNAAALTLSGSSSQILNQTSGNGLANFAANAGSGTFNIQSGRTFTTAGSFSNAGIFSIGSGSTFTVGGTGSFTQTAGTTTDNGTLALPSSGKLNLQSGSLFGQGAISGAVTSSGTVTPGASSTTTGILKDTGAYTQNSSGVLNISIAGTTAGTQYDQLNPTSASLNGTLNITRPTGFVPTVGSTFKILNFSSETGTFAKVNGLTINSTENFTLTYQPSDVLLTVTAASAAKPSSVQPAASGFGSFQSSRRSPMNPAGVSLPFSTAIPARPVPTNLPLHRAIPMGRDIQAYAPAPKSNAIASVPSASEKMALGSRAYGVASASSAASRRTGPVNRSATRPLLEYNLNVFTLAGANRTKALRAFWRQPSDPDAPSLGYLTLSGTR